MTVFVTKHALTKGIQEFVVESCGDGMVRTLTGPHINSYVQYFHGEGRDWHRILEGAQKRAEEMRIKKIESLNKSIKKLEKLRF